MKKLSLVLCTLALLLLTGCSSAQKNLDNLKQELAEIRQELEQSLTEKTALVEQNQELQNRVKSFEYNDAVSFKGIVKMTVTVLDKLPGSELYPYYVLATDRDVDHNTPLLLTTESKQVYEALVVGQEYTFRVFVINVVQREDNHIRYTFTIID